MEWDKGMKVTAPTPMALKESSDDAGAGTRPRSITETVNGSHHLTIGGYSLAKGMGVGKYISSDTFSVGGHQWAIYFYPDGKNAEDNRLYVSVFIVLASDSMDVRALFELSLLDQTIKTQHKVHSNFDREPCTLKNRGSMMGYKRFVLRAKLETSDFLMNDMLSIRCTVGVVVSSLPLCFIPVPLKPELELGQQLSALSDRAEGDSTISDVTFEVDGEVILAHKEVLAARSPVFKVMLYGPMGDGKGGKIVIKEIEAPVFKAMLHFIYRGVLPDTNEIIEITQQLLAAADRFGLDSLRVLCEVKLCKAVSIDTVARTLALADQLHASQLKAVCLRYAAAHLAAVRRSDGFKYLKDNFPYLEADVLVMADVLAMQSDGFKYWKDSFPSVQECTKVLRIVAGIDEERSWTRN